MSARATQEAYTSSALQENDFWSILLRPGSSLNPTFLRILDAAFVALLLIFLALLYLLSGSIHIIFLIIIELCLWASVKWYVCCLVGIPLDPLIVRRVVVELRKTAIQPATATTGEKEKDE